MLASGKARNLNGLRAMSWVVVCKKSLAANEWWKPDSAYPDARAVSDCLFYSSERQRPARRIHEGRESKLQVALHQFPEFLAVFILHVHEFHALALGTDVADHSGEMNLAQSRANLELNGVANRKLFW
jgi:hypothetical protein